MEHEITVIGGVFEVMATGSATPQGFIEMFADVIKNQNWSPGCCLIVDFRQLSDFNTDHMDFKGVSSVASYIKRHGKEFHEARVATLLRDTMDSKVVAGLMSSLNEFYGSDIDHDIFIDHEEAVGWVKHT